MFYLGRIEKANINNSILIIKGSGFFGTGFNMLGIILAILAGLLISLQSIFNAKVNEQVGHWLTTTLVLGLGFVTSFMFFIITERNIYINYEVSNYVYYISGLFGIGIVIFIMKAIFLLGPAYTILISLITQLSLALIIDSVGLFNIKQISFEINKLMGLFIIIIGVGIFIGIIKYTKKSNILEDVEH